VQFPPKCPQKEFFKVTTNHIIPDFKGLRVS
jgi:hypothetical protein